MTLSKTLSTLSLAGALVAAAVALSPSNAAAAFKSQHPVTVVIGGPGGVFKPKPKPAKPPRRECKKSDRCRG
jgi:ABC-type sugar transport system substrate-binding protein